MYAFSMHGRRSRRAPTTSARLFAISAETGKTLWKYDQRAGMMSLVATGGGLLFGGDTNGRFRAFDQDAGQGAVGDESRLARDRLSRSRT